MTSNRQDYRQHSKSTLLRAAQVLFEERRQVDAKWRRRVIAAAAAALVVGIAIGAAAGGRVKEFLTRPGIARTVAR